MRNLFSLTRTTLFRNTFIYAVARIINKLIPFLILPIITVYLTPSEYGLIATFVSYTTFLTVLVQVNMASAVNVNYFKLSTDQLRVYVAGSVLIVFVNFLLAVGIILIFAEDLKGLLSIDRYWLITGAVMVAFQYLTELNAVLWQAEQKAKSFAFFQIIMVGVNVTLVILLVVGYKLGWQGKLMAEILSVVSFGCVSLLFLKRRGLITTAFKWIYIVDALKFGIPMVPHTLASWLKSGLDKVFLTSLIGVGATGLYSIGFQFAYILGILALSFNQAFAPYLYKKLNDIKSEEKKKLVLITYVYFIGIVVWATILSFLLPWVIETFLDEKYLDAIEFVPFILFGFAFYGMYLMVVNYIFYVKKTVVFSFISILTGLVHAGLSYSLISIFGAVGAGYATLLSSILTFILVWTWSAKVYNMPWNLLAK